MTPSGIEPATFWLVAQSLNQLTHLPRVSRDSRCVHFPAEVPHEGRVYPVCSVEDCMELMRAAFDLDYSDYSRVRWIAAFSAHV